MDVRQLRYFLAVVDHGGVQRASEALYVAQPSVSQALKKLERDVGSTLFRRHGRHLSLTSAGEALVQPAREASRWVELARDAVVAVEDVRAGSLRLISTPSQTISPLVPLVVAMRRRHPGVQVVVSAADRPEEVLEAVRQGRCEVGLVATVGASSPVPGLVHQHVERQPFVVVSRAGGPLAASSGPVDPAELAGLALVAGQPGTGMRRAADHVLACAPGAHVAVEIEHREALLPMVRAGLGVAVVSSSWVPLAADLGLVSRELAINLALEVSLVCPATAISTLATAFLALASRWTREHA